MFAGSKSVGQSDHLPLGTPSPFPTNESMIAIRGDNNGTVHNVVIAIGDTEKLKLVHFLKSACRGARSVRNVTSVAGDIAS